MSPTRRILFVSAHPRGFAPSQRFRFEQGPHDEILAALTIKLNRPDANIGPPYARSQAGIVDEAVQTQCAPQRRAGSLAIRTADGWRISAIIPVPAQ